MSNINPPAPNPCDSCPYRRDVPSGVWSAAEYQKLPEFDLPTGDQPFAVFQCHQNDRDSDKARLCAGWVAVHGEDLMALRIGVLQGRLDASIFDYATKVPLFESGAAACDHGMRDIEHPSAEAVAFVEKICAKRPDAAFG
jgi:hypothetical protein